jgi:hypothetical protein
LNNEVLPTCGRPMMPVFMRFLYPGAKSCARSGLYDSTGLSRSFPPAGIGAFRVWR